MTKFKTAEEFLSLSEEERKSIALQVVNDWRFGKKLIDYTTLNQALADVEALAYAVGDEILKIKVQAEAEGDDDLVDNAQEMLYEFMSGAASECNLEYGGEYMDHEDGFWLPSNC